MQAQSFWRRNLFDIVFLVAVLASSVVIFSLEILAAERTQLNDALFGSLEFILALATGILIQRIASREEFLRSLRQYAFSAFRRITDIKKSADRLRAELDRIRPQYPRDRASELDVVSAVTYELETTINSSVLDWVDIIGEEIVGYAKAQALQQEIALARPAVRSTQDDDTQTRLESLQSELSSLRSELPLVFQASLQTESLPREGRFSPIVLAHYVAMAREFGHIQLRVLVSVDEDPGLASKIQNGSPFRIWDDSGMSKFRLGIALSTGEWVGPIENPFEETEIYGNDFFATLFDFLPVGTDTSAPGERPSSELTGSEFGGFDPGRDAFYVRIPIDPESLPNPYGGNPPGAG